MWRLLLLSSSLASQYSDLEDLEEFSIIIVYGILFCMTSVSYLFLGESFAVVFVRATRFLLLNS